MTTTERTDDACTEPQIITLGETMAVFASERVGPLWPGSTLRVSIAGAESNVAIGAARLGARSAWIGRVGADEFGTLILRQLRAEGVDDRFVVRDPAAPTGVMFKHRRTMATTAVTYRRAGSAGSRLAPEDIDEHTIGIAEVLHVTGITPALSASARSAVFDAVDTARSAGTLVSFDPNHRSQLWDDEEALHVYTDLTRRCDVLLAGEDEAAMLAGAAEPATMAAHLRRFGPSTVIIKRGAHGIVADVDGTLTVVPAVPVDVVDPVGAGDAFAAGYLTAVVRGADPATALEVGVRLGAWSVGAEGDWEGLPTWAEQSMFATSSDNVSR